MARGWEEAETSLTRRWPGGRGPEAEAQRQRGPEAEGPGGRAAPRLRVQREAQELTRSQRRRPHSTEGRNGPPGKFRLLSQARNGTATTKTMLKIKQKAAQNFLIKNKTAGSSRCGSVG